MSRIVFMVEERSMKVLLDQLLPRLFPGIAFLCVEHEGKSDLERSIPIKLKAWREPGVRFFILRDNDNGDCIELKRRLAEMANATGRERVTVRIVCQELEAWYFGDCGALSVAYNNEKIRGVVSRAKYRIPDSIMNPSSELARLIPEYQKISGARLIADHLVIEDNTSSSFCAFISAVKQSWSELANEHE